MKFVKIKGNVGARATVDMERISKR